MTIATVPAALWMAAIALLITQPTGKAMLQVEMNRTTDRQAAGMPESADEIMQVRVRGEGPPLVLVPGGLTGWASWEPHAAKLERTRTVASVQLLNVQYGLEGRPLPTDYDVPTEVAALRRALDGIGWRGPVDVAAWSYGALVALEFALAHPERIRTLTLIEPPAFWVLEDGGAGDPSVEPIRSIEIGDTISEADLATFARGVGITPPESDPRELPQWAFWMEHRQSLRMLKAPLEFPGDADRLARFDRPVLLVTGTGTAPFHRRIHEELAARLPHATAIELPGGHGPHVVSMEPFLAELQDFHAARYATSTDGTRIGFVGRGRGPAVLFIHGASTDRRSWLSLAPYLEQHITLYGMDRRGRGLSDDASEYSFEREAEDVAAVIEAIGEPVAVFGHSLGGLVALETSRLSDDIARLILYEPAVPREDNVFSESAMSTLHDLIARREFDAAMRFFLEEIVVLDDETLRSYEQSPFWKLRIPNVPTIPRELEIDRTYVFDPARFAESRIPTTLFVGGASPQMYADGVRTVHEGLPGSEVVRLEGQQHAAHLTAPELIAGAILRAMQIGRDAK